MNQNVLISSWPGAGASALSLLLTKKFNYTLLRGTELFRFLGSKLGAKNTGQDRIKNDSNLEPIFGPIFDKYIDYKLQNGTKLIVEADIGGFRLGKQDSFFSIFVYADREKREERLKVDGRNKDVDVLEQREKDLQKQYLDLHNIDWLDLDLINEKYNLPLDNSKLSISEELKLIYIELFKNNSIDEDLMKRLMNNSDQDEKQYWEKGKEKLVEELKKNNQVMSIPDILKDMKTVLPGEFEKLPEKIAQIINTAIN